MLDLLRKLKVQLIKYYQLLQTKKFIKTEFNFLGGGGTSIEVSLLLLAHALEKGMGLPDPRPHFGYEKAIRLLEILEDYRRKKMDVNRFAFVEAFSVLGAYFEFTDNDMSQFVYRYQQLSDEIQKCKAGYLIIRDMQDVYNQFDMEQAERFMETRHSIRSYSKEPVEHYVLQKVISLANHAPSACNRQPTKVYIASDKATVSEISALIPGNKGFEEEVPNWMIVTSDKKMFGISEPLQWYVNGGIYLAYLVEALHAYHLGSCIFQISGIHSNTKKLYTLASVPANETIIAAVGFGYTKPESKILAAERRPVDEVMVKI